MTPDELERLRKIAQDLADFTYKRNARHNDSHVRRQGRRLLAILEKDAAQAETTDA